MGCCQGVVKHDQEIHYLGNFDSQRNKLNSSQIKSELEDSLQQSHFNQSDSNLIYMNFSRIDSGDLTIEQFDQKYKKEHLLASGAYGDVWIVNEIMTNQKLAAKIISTTNLQQKDLKKFNKEADMLQSINHPNIIAIKGKYQGQHELIQVVDYCHGGTLRQLMSQHLDIQTSLDVFFNVIRGLHHLHKCKYAHRDIKPENIMFPISKGKLPIKLIDFGAFKKIKHQKFTSLIGTSVYLAPEVIKGEYDERCDVWSAGVILLEMLSKFQTAGENPFDAVNIRSTFRKILSWNLDQQYLYDIGFNLQIIQLLDKVLEKDYTKRPSAKWFWNNRNQFVVERQMTPHSYPQLKEWQRVQNLPQIYKILYNYLIQNVIPSQKIENLIQRFMFLDSDNDGFINKNDLVHHQGFWDTNYLEITDNNLFQRGMVSYSQYMIYSIDWRNVLTKDITQIAYKKLIQQGNIRRIIRKLQNKDNMQEIEQIVQKIEKLDLKSFQEFLIN